MKIYDTCKCFMKSRHKDIPLTLWVFRGNRLGNGYCLKGSEMVRFFLRIKQDQEIYYWGLSNKSNLMPAPFSKELQ